MSKTDWLLGEEVHNRVFGLDLMRAIAILIVVYMHGVFLLPEWMHRWYNLPVPGVDGVAIFFVLSGFLIGGILLRKLEAPQFGFREILNFWVRRWFRTIPNYMVVLTLVLVFSIYWGYRTDFFHWGYYFFTQNLFERIPRFFPESWSLAVEEWFYLVTPLLIWGIAALLKDRRKAVLVTAALLIVVPVVLRFAFFDPPPVGEDTRYMVGYPKIVIFRLDALMYGVIMAYLWRYHREACLRVKTIGLVLSLLLVAALTVMARLNQADRAYMALWVPSLEPLPALLALPFLANWKVTQSKALDGVIRFVSTVSYSMYLLNLSLIQRIVLPALTGEVVWGKAESTGQAFLRYFLFWTLTLLLSWLLFRFFERPVRDLRDRIAPERR